jgi:1-acyl-sn-glycerol-3-phosphate acyltransferase
VQQNFLKNIFHPLFRIWIRLTTYFFFERVIVTGKENIPANGPIILACNHPDSFLDALLVTAYYERPIYYLARGDVFANKFLSAILGFLNIIPIYRKEEGVINFPKNESTFSFCIKAFKKNGTVLIFSEGGSENKWELRQLRKGTARLTYSAWHNNEIGPKLQILPTSIAYSGWMQMNSIAYLTFIEPITQVDFPDENEHGIFLRKFNSLLADSLKQESVIIKVEEAEESQKILTGFLLKNKRKEFAIKVIENISTGNELIRRKALLFADYLKTNKIKFYMSAPSFTNFVIGIFIIPIAFLLNCLPYYLSKYSAKRITNLNEFYDSVLFCLLLLFYPIYLIVLFFIVLLISGSMLFGTTIIIFTLLSAKLFEWANRHIYCYTNKNKMTTISIMLNEIFGKDND